MPKREGEIVRMEQMPLDVRLAELDRCQEHWYKLAAQHISGCSVLDVGAGTGYGLPILAAYGASVTGIDPLPAGLGVIDIPLEAYPDASFDVVTAMDVIEHVEDDVGFLKRLLRTARKAVFLSTPNWDRFRAINPYHFREYTAVELNSLVGSMGYDYEAWHSNDLPTLALPWRVPGFGKDATNFGVWVWKTERLYHRDEPKLDFWNTQQPSFLEDDRPNPARAAAVEIVRSEISKGVRSLVEVGPGPGYDYRDFFCRIPGLSYTAYEASAGLRTIFLDAAPVADVRLGTFLDLAPQSADLVYSKATLEHQRDFRDGLYRMIQAARRCVILNWYRPPVARADLNQDPRSGIYYNTYQRDTVLAFLSALDASVDVLPQAPPSNELWVIRRKPR